MELGVLKSFEFVSHLRRASVIVRVFGSRSGDIYVKGAPESMRDICQSETRMLFPPYTYFFVHPTLTGWQFRMTMRKRCRTTLTKDIELLRAQPSIWRDSLG